MRVMRTGFLTLLGLIASLTVAQAQYYGPAAAPPPSPQHLNNPPPRGTYTQPFGTDPGSARPYASYRGNLNANGYNPGNIANPYGPAPTSPLGATRGYTPGR